MLIKIAICDDDKYYSDKLVKMIEAYDFEEHEVEITTYFTGYDLLSENKEFHIIFMDVYIDEEYGIDVAKEIKEVFRRSLLVYMSSYSGFSEDMMNARPFAFLSKPFKQEWLFREIKEAILELESYLDMFFYDYRDGDEIKSLDLKDVMCLYSKRDNIYVVLKGNSIVTFKGNFSEVVEDMKKIHPCIVRMNKSEAINKRHITERRGWYVKIYERLYDFRSTYLDHSEKQKLKLKKGK